MDIAGLSQMISEDAALRRELSGESVRGKDLAGALFPAPLPS